VYDVHNEPLSDTSVIKQSRKNRSRKLVPKYEGPIDKSKAFHPVCKKAETTRFISNLKEIMASESATYTTGNLSTDRNFTALPGSSTCPGLLIVTIPIGAIIYSVDVEYKMRALNQGWKSEQRSQLRCVSPGGTDESVLYAGEGDQTGNQNYSRTGLDIANGVSGGGDITFELHAGRTWGGSGCNITYNYVRKNSWTITVYYTMDALPDFTGSPTNVATGQTVTFTDNSQGSVSSWDWNFGADAVPLTANTQGPHNVIYTLSGHKTVSLTVNGANNETKADYITVTNPNDWLHWDDGVNNNAVGVGSASVFQIAARFEPGDISLYQSYQITRMRVYIDDIPIAATFKVWQGSDQLNLTEYVRQSFTPIATSWVEVVLNTPYNVNVSQELWFGVEYDDPGTGVYPAGLDQTTDYNGKGNLYRLDITDPTSWNLLSAIPITGEWNVQAYLQPAGINWAGSVSSEWEDANNWSTFVVPQIGTDVVIPVTSNDPVINSGVTIHNLTIESGASLSINPESSLTVNGMLTNNAGESGLVIVSNDIGTGSLVQTSVGVAARFQRWVKGDPEAWHMLSSPMTGQEISGDFTPSGSYADGTGYDFYTWYEPDTSWVYLLNTEYPPTWADANGGINFIQGKGYLVSYQATNPTKEFFGTLNSGSVSINISKTTGISDHFGTNLVGNPYPSSIDWKATSGWDRTNLTTVGGGYDIWVWNDTAYNYGVYNSASAIDEGSLGASRYITPTQGFFVTALQSGVFGVTDEVRTNENSGGWLKSSSKASNMIFLTVQSPDGIGNDEVIIEFGHDSHMSGTSKKFSFIRSAPSLFFPDNGRYYSLLLLDSLNQHPVLPLSFRAGSDGNYILNAYFDPEYLEFVLLKDLITGATHDFSKNQEYSFIASEQDNSGRFVVQFKKGNFPNPHDNLPIRIFTSNKTLYIDLRLVSGECNVEVFNVMGRTVKELELEGGSFYEFNTMKLSGIYIVRITANEGRTIKKLMF